MNMLNSIILEGNICKECSVTQTAGGITAGTFTMEVVRHYKDSNGMTVNEKSYFDVYTYGSLADFASELEEGRGIRIVGRLKQEFFTDCGLKRSKVVVIAEHIEVKPDFKKGVNNEGKSKD